ncbi:MAG TPA: glycoside hydrolase 43 family protein, partial [Cyclobacteriaceae bacterium]|nr:glycoside hydrolase 43 family protein [Cyclobacteriaceae bacterium]
MSPGLPIMKSTDLVNWQLVSYAYDTLADMDELNLVNGKSMYGRGSWASSFRYHDGQYYVTTFAQTTGRTYVFKTRDPDKSPWKMSSFKPSYHDHSLFFDDDGRVYMIYGAGRLKLVELNSDASGIKEGNLEKVIIENASAPAKGEVGLPAEGSQLFKVNGKYYLFNIAWPKGGMRTVIVHRADNISGPYEARVVLEDRGIAQGGLIDTPGGKWYAYVFRDYGAVGRIPYLVPVQWIDGWPVLGTDGKVPESLDLPASKGLTPGIVASDNFTRKRGEPDLPLVWQWNHNPDNKWWSINSRKGFLRLTTGRIDTSFLSARNTLTQRTIGPRCSGMTSLDVTNMREGDFSGLAILQKKYGLVGVKSEGDAKYIVMINAESGKPTEAFRKKLEGRKIFFKIDCDFTDMNDTARFFFSLDGKAWDRVGPETKMYYTLPHFMGYRFGLFNYATKEAGGYVDFDYFDIVNGPH